ncbi:amino acid adenylation domain-containing protein [Janthinobacterium sp. NFX145]|uniref:non-ribosomal peptide synthetase n=1 Tax=Janthinobacterium sp. NFX145 TaxID=3415602 RepID=UPI003CC502B3
MNQPHPHPQQRPALTRETVIGQIQALLFEPGAALADADNLIALGLDSLNILRLVSLWRQAGADVTFAALIDNPRVDAWLALLAPALAAMPGIVPAVSAPLPEPAGFDPDAPFALTDVQHAYWIGRQEQQELGGVGCHAYIELDGAGVDAARLESAWQLVQAHHCMLRASFGDDGLQAVGATPAPSRVALHDLRGQGAAQAQAALEHVRERLSHRRLAVEQGEVMGIELSLLDGGRTRIHFDVDLLVADVQSLQIILRDLAAAYAGAAAPAADPQWRFARYLAQEAQRRGPRMEQARQFWQGRLASMPGAPGLPLRVVSGAVARPTFSRRTRQLTAAQWSGLRRAAAAHQVTPAMLLLAAYAEVLARWSGEARFLINIPLFDRQTEHPGIEEVVADFTSLLLLGCDFGVAMPFLERVRQLQAQVHADVAHAAYSGVRVQRDLARQRQGEGLAAPVVFACNLGTPLVDPQCRAALGQLGYMISQTPQVWLDHQVYEMDGGLLLAWDAVDALFPEGLLDDMFDAHGALIDWLLRQDGDWDMPAPALLPPAQARVRAAVNATEQARRARPLHADVFAQALARPAQVALIGAAGEEVNYGELARRALRVASCLRDQGVTPGMPVAVSLPRGVEQIVAVLGVLAAGACYVPVGVGQPASRRARIHRAAGIGHVLCQRSHWPELEAGDSVLLLDMATAVLYWPLAQPVAVAPDAPAYVIFTSGSTGEPKGVQIAHQAAANTVDDINARYGINASSRALALSALDFDLSVYDIFGLLGAGGALVLVGEEQRRDAAAWLQLVEAHGVTVWNSVPVLLDMLLIVARNEGRSLPLRQVMLSGDWIGLDLPRRLADGTANNARLIAMGGATEAAIWSNVHEVVGELPAHWTSIPYGRPLANQQYRVADAQGRDCPDWVAGELWIGGAGVADGYRGAPELTAQRFVLHEGQRWYRTGDRGRYWPDGTLEFLGRLDHQVKVRGHRIELGEIETALTAQAGVDQAVAVTVGTPASLAAALVVRAGVAQPEQAAAYVEELRRNLAQLLPDYMVPATVLLLEALPLSANGKVDRRQVAQLLAAQAGASGTAYEAPQGEREETVAALWQEVLGQERIGRRQGFFELGGDSLLATQAMARLKQAGLGSPLGLRLLFATPVLAEFAAQLQAVAAPAQRRQVVAEPQARHQPFALTEVQRAYWMGQTGGLPLSCGTLYLVELDGADVDLARLEQAWNRLVLQHDMLRAVVDADGQQCVLAEVPPLRIAVEELATADAAVAQERLHRRWEAHGRGEDAWPLHTLHALRYGGNRCRLGIFFNYMTLDGFSIKLLLDQLAALYRDPHGPAQAPGLSFRDYVIQVQPQPEAVRRAEAYWRGRLAGLPPAPALPLARDPQTLREARFARRQAVLPAPQWSSLCQHARSHGITPSVLLLTAYAQVLSQWSGGAAHTLNVTLFDRQDVHPDIHRVLGDFTSLAPVAFQPRDGAGLLPLARAMQQEVADALEHREVSSIWIQRERSRGMDMATASLPVVFTSTLGLGGGLFENPAPGFPEMVAGGLSETPQVWLDHQLYEYKGTLVLTWDAVEALFPPGMLDDMFSAYQALLASLTGAAPPAALRCQLPPAQAQVRAAVNATEQARRARPLHADVFAQALARPAQVALIGTDGVAVPYGELAHRALQVAAYLHAQGVTPGMPVAVSLPRGVGQIIAVLGVLAAGACYVPVGVGQPASRRARIHRAAGIGHVLCQRSHWPELEAGDTAALLDLGQAQEHAALAQPVAVAPDAPAYVIFTSGSTGEPKGVQIAHQAAANTVDDINARYGINASSRALALSALDFDLSVYDIFGLLGAGGALVLVGEEQRRDAAAWLQLVETHGVTVWNSVPVLLDMLLIVARNEGRSLPLRQVMLSGDWIGLDLPRRLADGTGGAARLIAMGGATEAAIWSNVHEVVGELPAHWTSIPYGRPLANQQYRVADAQGRDCPDWVAGELWIGGAGVADGYRGAPELTAQRFVLHEGQRWYRTGDRGRYWPDGTLEFLGRLDHQVKVRGHRIELGEIETALTAQAGVDQAVAVTVGTPASLAAALVVRAGVAQPEYATAYIEALRQNLAQLLPDYMVPATVLLLEALPLSANGKVDRRQVAQLLAAQAGASGTAYEAPQGEREETVAALWQEVLGQERIGRRQGFFELGGDSLLATQAMARLKQAGLGSPLGLRLLFVTPVLAEFAAQLQAVAAPAQRRQVVAEPQARHQPFALTEVQRAYWMGQTGGLPLSCGTHYLVELDGADVDLTRLERAWNRLVQRHDMLRVLIGEDGLQRVQEQVPAVHIALDAVPAASPQEAQARLHLAWEEQAPALGHWPLFELKAVSYRGDGGALRCRIGMFLNYMALDGYSIKLLLNELALLYGDDAAVLPACAITFRDYVTQVQPDPQALEKAEAYWRGRLADLPPAPALPLARDPQSLAAVRFRRRAARLDAVCWQALRQQARAHGITPSVLVLTVYAQILSQWSGGAAHTLNLTLFDRQDVHADIQHVLGDFTSLAPVAFQPRDGAGLLPLARAMQQEIADALEHREVSSVWVQRERAKSVGMAAAALPVVFTSTLGIADSLFDQALPAGFPDLADGGLSETPQVWLDHQMYEHHGELLFSWDAVDELFPDGMIDSMFAAFVAALKGLEGVAWNAPPAALPCQLPPAQAQVRAAVNATEQARRARQLHADVFAQALARPAQVALIGTDGVAVPYGELAHRALQVAAYLHAQGVTPGMPVAVSLPRGAGQIIAVLGVLAAGACYVPVGVGQPASRRARIHRAAGIGHVLCQRSHWPELEAGDTAALLDLGQAQEHAALAQPVAVAPDAPAYVIFTSGSTGEPKGVQIAHQAAANTVDDINARYGIDSSSRALALSALDFDLSVYDIFGLLGAGGALVLVGEEQRRDAAAWLQLVEAHGVTVWNSVPVLLDMLLIVARNEGRSLPLRQVMLSGDWIGLDLPRRLADGTGGAARLIAMGGATEAAIWSNVHEVVGELPAHWTSIPYGRPLANQQYRVADAQGRDCPDWVAGELWIGGAGVADGYRGAPELTAQRFVLHEGQRWYRTGDRGRYWPDGTLEFLGRLDHQVKVRGHRIELGEIETALTAQAGVDQAVAVTVGTPASLAAALVVRAGVAQPEQAAAYVEELRRNLAQLLPDYMVPATVLLLEALPLSENGKVDRRQVAQRLGDLSRCERIYQEPRDALEAAVAAIWEEVLKRERISRDDDFFAIGGDSLSATRIVALLQERRVGPGAVPLRMLFGAPSIAALAAQVRTQWQELGAVGVSGDELIFEEGAL